MRAFYLFHFYFPSFVIILICFIYLLCRRILRSNPPMLPSFSSAVKDFIAKLLQKDPKKRMGTGPKGVEEIKKHVFFKVVMGRILKIWGVLNELIFTYYTYMALVMKSKHNNYP